METPGRARLETEADRTPVEVAFKGAQTGQGCGDITEKP